LREMARRHGLKIISIEDLIRYRLEKDSLIEKMEQFPVETRFGAFDLHVYRQTNKNHLHFALTLGQPNPEEIFPVRVESQSRLFDFLQYLQQNPDKHLEPFMRYIREQGKGAIIFVYHKRNWPEMLRRIEEYARHRREGRNELPPVRPDEKDYGIGAQIIHDLGIRRVEYLTHHRHITDKTAVQGFDIHIEKTTPLG